METRKYTLRLPAEMDFRNICRGAQTGWPQLINALKKLREDSDFLAQHKDTFAAAPTHFAGNADQLVSALSIDPSWMSKPQPPSDVYSWSVWITARVYECARTVTSTLSELDPFMQSTSMSADERAAIIKEVLHDLREKAEYASKLTAQLQAHVSSVSDGFEASRQNYSELRNSMAEFSDFNNDNKKMFQHVGEHAAASSFSTAVGETLEETQKAAANVTAYAVLANMGDAMGALSNAWEEVRDQFDNIIQRPTEEIGDPGFIRDTLEIGTAITEWQGFSDITKNYLKQAVLVR